MRENLRPRLMLMGSMVIFGTLAPFVRNIGVSSGELALYRAVMAAVLVGGFLLLSGQKIVLKGAGRELWLLLISGGAMGINWILLFEAYKYTTVSVATLSYYFAPVIVTALCPLLFREKLTKKQLVCFLLSTAGLVLVINVGGLAGGRDKLPEGSLQPCHAFDELVDQNDGSIQHGGAYTKADADQVGP